MNEIQDKANKHKEEGKIRPIALNKMTPSPPNVSLSVGFCCNLSVFIAKSVQSCRIVSSHCTMRWVIWLLSGMTVRDSGGMKCDYQLCFCMCMYTCVCVCAQGSVANTLGSPAVEACSIKFMVKQVKMKPTINHTHTHTPAVLIRHQLPVDFCYVWVYCVAAFLMKQ